MEKETYLKHDDRVMQHGNGIDPFEKRYDELMDLAVHDLDAPLRKLTLLVGMLTGKLSSDKDMQVYVDRITGCIGDMRSLIDDLSALSKVNANDLNPVSCNMDQVIQDALQELPDAIKHKQAVISSTPMPVIEADQGLMVLLFKNLIGNAIKFSDRDRHPEIQVASSTLTTAEKNSLRLDAGRNYYQISINDNGIGFRKEDAAKIFEPFVRLHGKSQFTGNGIGLAISRKIIEIHHGIIYAEGRENEGAKFILILPESH